MFLPKINSKIYDVNCKCIRVIFTEDIIISERPLYIIIVYKNQ